METLARTSLRRFGNSTGMVVPKAVLHALDAKEGDTLELGVGDDGRLVAARPGTLIVEDGVVVTADEAETLRVLAKEVGDAVDRMIARLDLTSARMREALDPAREAELQERYRNEYRGKVDGLFEALAR